MSRRLVIAFVVIASACGKKDSAPAAPPASGAGSGSAASSEPAPSAGSAGSAIAGSAATAAAGSAAGTGSAADPWSKPAAPAPPSDAPCNDDDIRKHIEDSLRASLAYKTALEKKTAKWSKDCEAAKKDLIALEPEATKFMATMNEFKSWAQTLGAKCGARVSELGEKMDAARDIDKGMPGLEAKVKPILEKCQDHPGFADAAAKGLRLMRRRRAP